MHTVRTTLTAFGTLTAAALLTLAAACSPRVGGAADTGPEGTAAPDSGAGVPAEAPCEALVQHACGPLRQCGETRACTLAEALAEASPDTCGETLETLSAEDACGAHSAVCAALTARVCGEAGDDTSCLGGAVCTAAQLLAMHEPSACAEAQRDTTGYPTCTQAPCDALVERVCDADCTQGTCAASSACALACDLAERVDGEDVDARAAAISTCATGLEDGATFPTCAE